MFHPDQCYDLQMLQQQDLRMEILHIRLAAQAGEQSQDRLARMGAIAGTLARRLGGWLRLTPISYVRHNKG